MSKTISREIGQQIIENVIKKYLSAITHSSQFKFWVNNKHFELINHRALGDVYLPAKSECTHVRTITIVSNRTHCH